MATVNWIGTGLSSLPGLKRLIEAGYDVVVWNRMVEKAQDALRGLTVDIRAFDLETFQASLKKGDLAISMLPGE